VPEKAQEEHSNKQLRYKTIYHGIFHSEGNAPHRNLSLAL